MPQRLAGVHRPPLDRGPAGAALRVTADEVDELFGLLRRGEQKGGEDRALAGIAVVSSTARIRIRAEL